MLACPILLGKRRSMTSHIERDGRSTRHREAGETRSRGLGFLLLFEAGIYILQVIWVHIGICGGKGSKNEILGSTIIHTDSQNRIDIWQGYLEPFLRRIPCVGSNRFRPRGRDCRVDGFQTPRVD